MRKYKNSGTEWIGKVPADWRCFKMLYALKQQITDGPHETPVSVEGGIPFISVDSLNDSETVDLSVASKFISEEDYDIYNKKAILSKGDVLFSKAATIGKTAIVGDEKFMVWSPLAILKPNYNVIMTKYLYYMVNCNELIKYVSLLGGFTTQINVGMKALEKAIIPIPPISEQIQISDYLDVKCSEIDKIISAKEKTNELLVEHRKSIISEVVTKGLNPDVEMKDSGVEWIGEIPTCWGCKKTKYIFTIKSGATPKTTNSEYWDGDVDWITPADYKTDDVYVKSGHKKITHEGLNSCATSMIPQNSIVFSKRAPVGAVAINTHSLCTNQGCLACIPNSNVVTKYYYYLMSTLEEQYRLYAFGTTFEEISYDAFSNFILPVPNTKEQQEITDYLDNICSKINKRIKTNNETIEKLKEYRNSLIYEAVTGKIEIPERG